MKLELMYNKGILMIWRGQEHLATFDLPRHRLGAQDWIDLPGEVSEKLAQILSSDIKKETV